MLSTRRSAAPFRRKLWVISAASILAEAGRRSLLQIKTSDPGPVLEDQLDFLNDFLLPQTVVLPLQVLAAAVQMT